MQIHSFSKCNYKIIPCYLRHCMCFRINSVLCVLFEASWFYEIKIKTPVRKLIWNVRWPRELNTLLHLQKTHANRKSTSKSRKLLHQFDSRCCKCSQINNLICFFVWLCCEYLGCFFIYLCCEHLQHVCCKMDKVVFLICRVVFYLQRIELSRPP